MKNQNIVAMNISFLKTHWDSRILHSRTAKKSLADNVKESNFLFYMYHDETLEICCHVDSDLRALIGVDRFNPEITEPMAVSECRWYLQGSSI